MNSNYSAKLNIYGGWLVNVGSGIGSGVRIIVTAPIREGIELIRNHNNLLR